MPSWKKVVASGSDASFSSLSVDTYVSASSFKGSFTGSLQGTSSWAVSSSYALTASYALNGGGGGVSAIYIQDEGITQGTASYFNFTGAGVTATVANSTASINIPGGGGTSNNASNAVLNQSSPAVTWSFTHNLGAKYPVFTVFDSSDNVIIPQQIHAVDTASALIYFSTARTGTAVASVAGNVLTSSYSVSSSYADLAKSASYAYTASSAVFAFSASYANTASFANNFTVAGQLTASGLYYPTTDGAFAGQTLQTNALGSLAFADVETTFDTIYNGEATTLVKGTPVYVSGSQGANPRVYRADASDSTKMPVFYIVSENIATASTGRGVTLGHVEGIDLTGYTDGTSIYAASGGGWTSTRPTGANTIIQFLGVVTKGGAGGKGLVLNPGPATLPNLQSGSIWVGNSSAYPTAVTTSSLLVASASYAYTASSAISSSYAYTASSASTSFSSSYAATSSFANNFTVANTLTAQTLVVQTITSSITYSSGSNIFGNSTANTQTMTGSLNVSGSATIIGRVTISDHTGSLFGTSSWAQNAQTSSYVLNAVSSSYAFTASSAINASASLIAVSSSYAFTASSAINASASLIAISASYAFTASSATSANSALTASYILNAVSASYAYTASSAINASASLIAVSSSYAFTASSAINSSLAQTASYVLNAVSSSYSFTASSAINASASLIAISASYAFTASSAINASASLIATSASYSYTASSATSASLAQTASYVVTAQTASYVANAVSSSYAYTASSAISSSYAYTASSATNASASLIAVSASYALTASYALNGGGGGLSALYIGDEAITQGTASYINFTGAGVTATVSAGTASINIPGGSSGTAGLSTTFTQSVAAVSWSFTHNLNTRYPLVQVYDTTFNQVNPQYISSSNASTVIIGFGVATAGYAVASSGGTLYVTGSNVILDQAVAATTWSFTHNLNTQYPVFQVFNSSNEVVIPQRIVATDATSSLIYFPSAVSGKAVASVGGISGSMGSGVGFPFSGSAVITGSFLVSQSFVDFSKAAYVTGSFTGSLFGTSSWSQNAYTASSAISASYSTFAISASFAPGFTTNMSQSVAATTWSFTHNLNTINPIVQVYDLTNAQIVPNQIVGMNNSTAEIRFDYAQAGYAVASNGGGLYVTGSTATLVQAVGAVTWSFTHNLNNKYNTYEVYDNNDTVIIPSGIKALTNNTAEIYFSVAQTGRVVGSFSGINGSPNAATASYSSTASFVSNLTQNVFISGSLTVTGSAAFTGSFSQNSGFVVLTQVSQSLNYADDVAAAAGGVPLGGLYRNGNFILIRLS